MIISVVAMSAGARKVVSAISSRRSPAMAAGTVPMMRYTNRHSSGVRIARCRRIERADSVSAPHSFRKYHRTVTSVPRCNATSKARPGSFHPNAQGVAAIVERLAPYVERLIGKAHRAG